MPPKKGSGEKKTKSSTSAGAGGRKKGTSAYNIFMKKKLEEYKESHPDLHHKERFKKVASEWATSSDNPKNAATSE